MAKRQAHAATGCFCSASEAKRFVDEFSEWEQQTGGKCVAVNIVMAPNEMESPEYAAIIAEKVRQAASGLTTSAMVFAEAHRAKAVVTT